MSLRVRLRKYKQREAVMGKTFKEASDQDPEAISMAALEQDEADYEVAVDQFGDFTFSK
jgi:hypothetical protein